MLDRVMWTGDVERAARNARMVVLALTIGLLVAIVPHDPDLIPVVYGLFVMQVVLGLGALALELVKLAYARAERAALQRNAVALLAAHDDRLRAIEERDELKRTAAGLRALNEQLRGEARQRDDAVASAVHELRTPLTSVQAYGQLMTKNLQAVQRQVGQLERLISDLLDLPGAKPLAAEEVDVVREAREAANRLRLVTDAKVSVAVADDGPHVVRGDVGRIGQVLDNLLRNAAKFSPPGKTIDVTIRRVGDEVVLAVTDQGRGIPAEDLPLVFERYNRGSGQSRDVPGEGIGLAVSREIVQMHHGRIWATSPGPGKGSTFTIAMPVAVPQAVAVDVDGEAVTERS